jgi:hypothetical protein
MKVITLHNNHSSSFSNISTRVYVLILGILAGLAGMAHGIFEILQGNKPTEDILVRIGAYTIIPNYLVTGIVSVVFSLLILIWTIWFIHKHNGTIVYLLLIIILFFVGGGIAPIMGLLITWAVATRIDKSLTWWGKVLPEKIRKLLARQWLVVLITGIIFLFIGIGIWLIFTPPGEIYQITIVDYVCWSFLCLGFLFQILTIISGFACDIERQSILSNPEKEIILGKAM